MKVIDLTGQQFGRLTVLARKGSLNGHAAWLCECECGKRIVTRSCDLRNGKTTSCGCFHNEIVANITKSHGQSGSRLYNIYNDMKLRCCNSNNREFHRYGGRGIKICEEWLSSFEAFYTWAMASGYSDSLTIDRIDNDGNYEPSNCRWVTVKIQNNNRRSNRNLIFKSEAHSMQEWSEITGISRTTIKGRLQRGWTIEKALTKVP